MKNAELLIDLKKLQDIIAAIDALDGFKATNAHDRTKLHAAAFEFTIIGEAARQISTHFKRDHPHLPWREMQDMRNKIVHEYDGLSPKRMEEVVEDDLPGLRAQLDTILEPYLKHFPPLELS